MDLAHTAKEEKTAGGAVEGMSKSELRRLRKDQQQAEKAAKASAKKGPMPPGKGDQPPKQAKDPLTTSKSQHVTAENKENTSNSSAVSTDGQQSQNTVTTVQLNKDMPPGFRHSEPLKSILKRPEVKKSVCDEVDGGALMIPSHHFSADEPHPSPLNAKVKGQMISVSMQQISAKVTVGANKQSSRKKSTIFHHIPQRCQDVKRLTAGLEFKGSKIHPLVIRVGLSMNQGLISGSNPRCVAMLTALRRTIMDYERPEQKEFVRDLQERLDLQVKFISDCRPLAVSMINAIKFLKLSLYQLQQDEHTETSSHHHGSSTGAYRKKTTDDESKKRLIDFINNFIREEIKLAQDGITECAIGKINDSDEVILTYGSSPVVKQILLKAKESGKKFRVMVVDSRPRLNGRHMVDFCVAHRIPVAYLFLNGISHVMRQVTKVLIGAHSLLANGYVMGQVGASMIALVASAFNVPVLVCCETYKFSEKVDTDSFVHNELSVDNLIAKYAPFGGSLDQRKEYFKHSGSDSSDKSPSVTLSNGVSPCDTLNMLYDVTPPSLVSLILTEKGLLPCNSVPAVLRVRHEQSYS